MEFRTSRASSYPSMPGILIVGDADIEGSAVLPGGFEPLQGIRPVRAGGDLHPLGLEDIGEDIEIGQIVVDDEGFFLPASGTRCIRGAVLPDLPNVASKWKVLPFPASLSAHILPVMSFAKRRLMVRPRPVPPYCRVVEVSAC